MVLESPDVCLGATTPHYQTGIIWSFNPKRRLVDRVHILTTEVPTSPIILSLHTSPFSTILLKIAFLCIFSFLETDACTPCVR